MNFTGKNLLLVRTSIDLAIAELRIQIATCPDVFRFKGDLIEIEEEIKQLNLLAIRIDKHLGNSLNGAGSLLKPRG